jgi:hypothetical protein
MIRLKILKNLVIHNKNNQIFILPSGITKIKIRAVSFAQAQKNHNGPSQTRRATAVACPTTQSPTKKQAADKHEHF